MDSTSPADDTASEPSFEPLLESSVEQPAMESAPAEAPEPSATEPAESEGSETGTPESEAAPEPATAEAAAPTEEPTSPGADASPREQLTELSAAAEKGRLSAADEERAVKAIRECLLDGRAGVAAVLETLPKFAWMVAVNGVTAAWPELTAGFRTQLFSGLAKDESDAARRLRLSLARGIFKLDVPAALKMAVGVAKDLRDKETGLLSTRHAQMFANVFIGRAKPWLATVPLTDLKPADADALVHAAVLAAFSVPHPPVTQLGVLKWAAPGGRLAKLHEGALTAILGGVARWSPKWQAALRKEVEELPDTILSALQAPAPTEEPAPAPEVAPDSGEQPPAEGEAAAASDREAEEREDEEEDRDQAPRPARQYPVYVSRTVPPREPGAPESAPRETPAREAAPRDPRDQRDQRDQRESREPREGGSREAREPREPREASQQRGQGGRGGSAASNFNLNETLRQIETYVSSLRNELKVTQSKLKDRGDDERRPRKPERNVPIIQGEPSLEELARTNHQLEARIEELQQRLSDLTNDAEDRAASSGLTSDLGPIDPDAALRALLALKLQEDYEDFVALERESIDIVVQAHYRTLLRHIFEVLTHEGVALKSPV